MTKLLKLALAAGVAMMLTTTTASAEGSAVKGQKLYLKKLKSACGFNGAKMTNQHTQDEWEGFYDDGKLGDEIKRICPTAKDKALKEKFMKHYYKFFYEFASDSGNVPSC